MISIIEHIEYLIRHHNCVVIPQWGAFIAQYSPSLLQAGTNKIIKPKRTIAFNASIDHNDGLLANSLVRRHGISYDKALKLITDSVSLYKRQLQNGDEVSFGRIGYFALNSNGSAEFTPFYQSNSNDEYFGLKSIAFKPLVNDNYELRTRAIEANNSSETRSQVAPSPTRNRFAYRSLQVAASIAIILGIAFIASTPIAVDRSQQNYASLNVPTVKKPNTAQVFTTTQSFETTGKEANSLDSDHPSKAATETQESGKYYLVISTFTSQQKAQQYIASHTDIQGVAKIRCKGNQYRVYIKRSNDYAALYHEAINLPAKYGNGWVTKD